MSPMDEENVETELTELVKLIRTATDGYRVMAEAASGYRKFLLEQGFSAETAEQFSVQMLYTLQASIMK